MHPPDKIWLNKEHQWNDIESGKLYPSVTFSTTNPTWTVLGVNPWLCGERPVTNCLPNFRSIIRFFIYFV